jgi:hypothetical protein
MMDISKLSVTVDVIYIRQCVMYTVLEPILCSHKLFWWISMKFFLLVVMLERDSVLGIGCLREQIMGVSCSKS